MPMARIAVMGPGGGVDFVYKDQLKAIAREYAGAKERGTSVPEAARKRDEAHAALTAAYERELLNPKEALSLGSVSSIVMPGESRRVLAENLNFLMRTYRPSPMSGVQREHE
jgi:acetyl-CoA carboxylase carboxyltransferase component